MHQDLVVFMFYSRDQDALKEWRNDGKKKQMEKYREKYIKGKIGNGKKLIIPGQYKLCSNFQGLRSHLPNSQ
jgi:hypothetical protein